MVKQYSSYHCKTGECEPQPGEEGADYSTCIHCNYTMHPMEDAAPYQPKGERVSAESPGDGDILKYDSQGWHPSEMSNAARKHFRTTSSTETTIKKYERPEWLKWYFLAFSVFELCLHPAHNITEWFVSIFSLMALNYITWWLFPHGLRLYGWFPTVSRLKAQNAYLISENKKLLNEAGKTGAYR